VSRHRAKVGEQQQEERKKKEKDPGERACRNKRPSKKSNPPGNRETMGSQGENLLGGIKSPSLRGKRVGTDPPGDKLGGKPIVWTP